jgi:hypothetical protein
MTAMWLWELPRLSEDDSASGLDEQRDRESAPIVPPALEVPLLNAPAAAFEASRTKEPVILDRK